MTLCPPNVQIWLIVQWQQQYMVNINLDLQLQQQYIVIINLDLQWQQQYMVNIFFLNVFIQFSTISSHLILLSGTRHVHSLLLFITKIVDSLPGGRCGRVPASGGGGESSL